MDERQSLRFFNSYFDPAKNHQRGLATNWEKFEQAYLGEPGREKPTGDESWRSFFFTKYGYQQVATLAAELAAEDDPTFVYEPWDAQREPYASVCSTLVGQQLQRDDYPTKRLLATICAAVYGGQPMKVHWQYQTVRRRILKPSGLREIEEIVVLDQPTITLIDPHDFYYDPRARSMKECRFVFHRMRLTYEELASRKRADGSPLYSNLDKVAEKCKGTGMGDGTGDDTRELDNDLAGERDKARREGIEVVEMWTRDRVIVRAMGNCIIRDDPNPYMHGRLPFEVAVIQPSLNDLWGMSIMWVVRDVQELLWTLDNAAMDGLKFAINPPIAVDVTADLENANRTFKPGQMYPAQGNAKDAVVPLRVTGAEPYVADQAIQNVRQQLKESTGITDEVAGVAQASTATEAAINQRQAKGRVGIMLRSMDGAFARCAEMILQLNQQFLDFSKPVRVLGPKGAEWKHIAPQQIAGMWDVRPKNSSERVIKELRRSELIEAIGSLMPMNGMVTPTGMTIDVTPLMADLVETFNISPEQVIVPMEQMLEQQGKQTIAASQQQAAAVAYMPPEPAAAAPAAPPAGDPPADLNEQFRITYKDLDPDAKIDLLNEVGISSEGVKKQADLDRREQEARISKLKEKPKVSGQAAGQAARRSEGQ